MFAAAVVGHTSRARVAARLADTVEAVLVTIDDGSMASGENHRLAWEGSAAAGREWSVVLEDDAIPVPGFREQVNQALSVAPSPIVSLYLGRSHPGVWQHSIGSVIARPASWLVANALLHHVGVAIRTDLVPQVVEWIRADPFSAPVDEVITLLSRHLDIPVAYTRPSLVDHDHRAPSVISKRTSILYDGESGERRPDPLRPRKAWLVGGKESWDRSCVGIPTPEGVDAAISHPSGHNM